MTNAKFGIKLLYVLNVIMVTILLMGNVKFLKQIQTLNIRLNLLHPMILYALKDLQMENVFVATLDLYLLTMLVLL